MQPRVCIATASEGMTEQRDLLTYVLVGCPLLLPDQMQAEIKHGAPGGLSLATIGGPWNPVVSGALSQSWNRRPKATLYHGHQPSVHLSRMF